MAAAARLCPLLVLPQSFASRLGSGCASSSRAPLFSHAVSFSCSVLSGAKCKAVGLVSYGCAMDARGVQQHRLTAIEVQLALVRSSVHISLWGHYKRGDVDAGLAGWRRPRGADRRSAVVDRSLEDGARQHLFIRHCAATAVFPTLFSEEPQWTFS
jgi:hypothetical protein